MIIFNNTEGEGVGLSVIKEGHKEAEWPPMK